MKMKKELCVALSIAMLISVGTTTVDVTAATKVKLNKTKLVLQVHDTYKLKLKKAKGAIKWSSSNATVASVDSKGKVVAKKQGNTVISAKNKKKIYKCKVKVNEKSGNDSSPVDQILKYLKAHQGARVTEAYGTSRFTGVQWDDYDSMYGRDLRIFMGYELSTNSILFKFEAINPNNSASFFYDERVYMVLDIADLSKAVVGFDFKSTSMVTKFIGESFTAEATIAPSTHTDDEELQLSIQSTNYAGVSEEEFNSWLPTQARGSLKKALAKYNEYLWSEMDLSLGKLGFANYL